MESISPSHPEHTVTLSEKISQKHRVPQAGTAR